MVVMFCSGLGSELFVNVSKMFSLPGVFGRRDSFGFLLFTTWSRTGAESVTWVMVEFRSCSLYPPQTDHDISRVTVVAYNIPLRPQRDSDDLYKY